MPDHDTEARAVAGKGHPITLDDGSQVMVRVDLDNLWEIEERFGSIDALSASLAKLSDDERASRPIFQPLIRALAVLMPWQREDLRDPKVLRRALDPALIGEYLETAVRSLNEAISTGAAEPADGRPNGQTAASLPDGSPGDVSTTQAPSSSVVPTPSSGG